MMSSTATFDDRVPELPEFIARQLPFRRRFYTLRRGDAASSKIHFIDEGPRDGRTVLLLHGNPTWSFLWRRVIRELPNFRCIAPDLLGLGLSDKPRRISDHSVVLHADAFAELIEALDVQDAILVAQDWGGPVGIAVGERQPDRFAGLIFANTAVALPKQPRGTKFHQLARTPVVSDLLFRVLGFPLRSLHKTQAAASSISGDVARAYRWPLRRLRDRVAPLALARMVPDSTEHPSYIAMRSAAGWAESFKGPVRLVWGIRDPVLGRALKRHRAQWPEAPVRELEAGHFLQEEVPEELAAAVRAIDSELSST
ncbi:MAG: alpha/beta fold hydrolase [Acidobacteriota bacterium]